MMAELIVYVATRKATEKKAYMSGQGVLFEVPAQTELFTASTIMLNKTAVLQTMASDSAACLSSIVI